MKICVCQVKRIKQQQQQQQQKLFRAFSRLYLQSQKRSFSLFCMLLFCFVLKQKHLVENKQQIISVKWGYIYTYICVCQTIQSSKNGVSTEDFACCLFFSILLLFKQQSKICRICLLNYNNNYNNNCCQSVWPAVEYQTSPPISLSSCNILRFRHLYPFASLIKPKKSNSNQI